jgi:hypothetical protein
MDFVEKQVSAFFASDSFSELFENPENDPFGVDLE